MIIDTLADAGRYFGVYPGIEDGIAFLDGIIGTEPEDGEYEIDGRRVYASVSSCEAVGKEGTRLEAHRKYIDIHFCIEGEEVIGWAPAVKCADIDEEYSEEKDIEFFADEVKDWVTLKSDVFCVFFPEDAHAPLAGEGKCRKIIVKIAV